MEKLHLSFISVRNKLQGRKRVCENKTTVTYVDLSWIPGGGTGLSADREGQDKNVEVEEAVKEWVKRRRRRRTRWKWRERGTGIWQKETESLAESRTGTDTNWWLEPLGEWKRSRLQRGISQVQFHLYEWVKWQRGKHCRNTREKVMKWFSLLCCVITGY